MPLELTNGTQYKEIALSYNWNVYKLFKSGNRAKAPITTFESTEELAQQHFDEVIKAQKLFFKTEIEFRKNLKALSFSFLKEKLRIIEELEINIKSSSTSSKLLFIVFVQNSAKENKII